MRIELTLSAWKAEVLPLNYWCIIMMAQRPNLTINFVPRYLIGLLARKERFELSLHFCTVCLVGKSLQPLGYFPTWSEWWDSNPRPLDPKSSTLPNCATLRYCLSFQTVIAFCYRYLTSAITTAFLLPHISLCFVK